ncbi:MAG: hypothetical protein V2B20_10525 [Pseudomonadota bacterium]
MQLQRSVSFPQIKGLVDGVSFPPQFKSEVQADIRFEIAFCLKYFKVGNLGCYPVGLSIQPGIEQFVN